MSAPPRRPLESRPPFPIRARAVLLGLALIPLQVGWAVRTEVFVGGSEMIESSLLPLAVFSLLVLTLLNDLLRRVRPQAAFTRAELLLIYVMQSATLGVAGLGQLQFLVQVLPAPFHHATPENEWASTFHPHIPAWWVPPASVLKPFYEGNSSLFTASHLRGWAVPALVWSGFLLTLWWGFLCLATMLRRHWIESERLAFPLVALPLALTEQGAARGLLRSRPFWIAVGCVFAFRTVSALPLLEPRFPSPPGLDPDAGQLMHLTGSFGQHPWNAVGYFALSFHPVVIGITYFLPQDVSLGIWLFYLLGRGEMVAAAALGAGSGAREVPYPAEQGMGAFLAIAALSLWGARRHLINVARKALGPAPDVRDDDEVISYRTAFWGFLAAFALLVGFATLGGLPLVASLVFFALYLVMIVAVARLRAEAGPMLSYGPDMSPHRLLIQVPGATAWDAASLTPLGFFHWFDSDYRTVALPQHLETFKIAEAEPGLRSRALARSLMGAMVVAVAISWLCLLALYYHYGAIAPVGDNGWRVTNGRMPWNSLNAFLNDTPPGQHFRLGWVTLGFSLTAALMKARATYFWWPLHPAGYALAHAGFSLPWVWFPTFLGWAAKGLLLRYGGMRLYRRALPVFLGLILGDVAATCLWSLLGLLLNTRMYLFFPG